MNLVEKVTDPQKKRANLNPAKVALASTKAILMSLIHDTQEAFQGCVQLEEE